MSDMSGEEISRTFDEPSKRNKLKLRTSKQEKPKLGIQIPKTDNKEALKVYRGGSKEIFALGSGKYTSEELKSILDTLYEAYCTQEFINSDPIQFVYKFSEEEDMEIVGFVASVMAQGRREIMIRKINELIFSVMRGEPRDYIENFDIDKLPKDLENFRYSAYREIKGKDIGYVLYSLKAVLRKWNRLKNLFDSMQKKTKNYRNVRELLIFSVDEIFSWTNRIPQEVVFLVPTPRKGSACKRLNMFLRWMVRKDKVDVGIWNDIIPTSKLIIPLDYHVAKISRELGLTRRHQNDWLTAEEITENLKELDPNDPVKYDIAIFGYGVSASK